MKIVVVAPSGVPYAVGGAEKLWWGLLEGLRAHTAHEVELLKIPSPEHSMRELIASYRYFSALDLNHFDLVISTKYPAWMVWHDNHWVYLQHKLRGLYDTYPSALPAQIEHWPDELRPLRHCLEQPARRECREALFLELERLSRELPVDRWDTYFALPSPHSRAVIHWLDSSALQPGMIKKYMAISQNVVDRDDYFPPDVDVQVIHHPSDLVPAQPRPGSYLFTASRLDKPKRLDMLIAALIRSNAPLKLLIAGDGPEKSSLQVLAKNDPRIQFLGRIPDREMRRYYAGALCVPYVPADEDYGLITVEAFQHGKPVLTTSDSGGVLELVRDGYNGWVVDANEAALAQALEALASDTGVASNMSAACKETVAHINWPMTIEQLLSRRGMLDANGFSEQGKPNKIVVPLTFPVWPPRTGGQNRIFHLYSRIARFCPVTLLSLCNSDEAAFDAEIAPGLREVRIPKSKQHQQGERVLENKLNASVADIFAIENMHLTEAYLQCLKELTRDAGLVVASHPYTYHAIRQVYRGAVYYEAHNVELDMKRDILGTSALAEPWLKLVRAIEGDCARGAIGISACSREDAARLQQLYDLKGAAMTIAPNGVDSGAIPYTGAAWRARIGRRMPAVSARTAVFMGSWHGPNIEAVEIILGQLAPRLPDCQFWILGSVCRYPFAVSASNVVFLGQLSERDKNSVLSCAQVAINPIKSGSGSNLKMAEYLAAGLPVVSTAFGCRGIDIVAEGNVHIAPLEEFAEKLENVVNRSTEGALDAMSACVRSAEVADYDWQGIATDLFAHMVTVCGKCDG